MKFVRTVFYVCAIVCVPILVQAQSPVFRSAGSPIIDISNLKLELSVSDTTTYLEGKAIYEFFLPKKELKIPFALSDSMTVTSFCSRNDYSITAIHRNDTLLLTIDSLYKAGDLLSFEIKYKGFAAPADWISGVFSEKDDETNKNVTWTLSEPYSSYTWFPAYETMQDKIDSSTVSLITPKGLKAGASGKLVKIDSLGNKVKYTWEHKYPLTYYLISFCVGDFMEYNTYAYLSNDSVLIQNFIYNDSAYLEKYKNEIDKTSDLVEYFSEVFGEYPFALEKYGHCNAPMGGGMENQTMTTIDHFSFRLVAHELSHQWFGNSVTCANFQDIWLNEGFATYSEIIALEYFIGKQAAMDTLNGYKQLAMLDKRGSICVPEEELDNIRRIFNYNLSYTKGGWLVHMLRGYVNNDSLFFSAIKDYLLQFRYGYASSNDFISALNKATGKNMSAFFNSWLKGKGYPFVKVKCRQRKERLYFDIQQLNSGGEKDFFNIYLDIEIITKHNVIRKRKYVTPNNTSFYIPVDSKVKKVIIDPDNWMLMSYSVELE